MWRKLFILAGLAVAAACSSDADEDPKGATAFEGTWTGTGVTQKTIDCVYAKDPAPLNVTYTVKKGTTADLQITSSATPNCPLNANVVGTRAAAVGGQTCDVTSPQYKDTYQFATTSELDMDADGGPQIIIEATFHRYEADGTDTGYDCGYTEQGPIKKN